MLGDTHRYLITSRALQRSRNPLVAIQTQWQEQWRRKGRHTVRRDNWAPERDCPVRKTWGSGHCPAGCSYWGSSNSWFSGRLCSDHCVYQPCWIIDMPQKVEDNFNNFITKSLPDQHHRRILLWKCWDQKGESSLYWPEERSPKAPTQSSKEVCSGAGRAYGQCGQWKKNVQTCEWWHQLPSIPIS